MNDVMGDFESDITAWIKALDGARLNWSVQCNEAVSLVSMLTWSNHRPGLESIQLLSCMIIHGRFDREILILK